MIVEMYKEDYWLTLWHSHDMCLKVMDGTGECKDKYYANLILHIIDENVVQLIIDNSYPDM